jgi:hypothetical protein
MLAALLVAAVFSLETCANCTTTARDAKLCEPHAFAERALLDREAPGLKTKEPDAAIASLEAIAALTPAHSNAPSARVVQALAAAYEHQSLRVRRRAAELTGPPQHPQAGLDALSRALADTEKQAKKLGNEVKSLDNQLSGKLTDKRRATLTEERKACGERSSELVQWRKALMAQLTKYPDDRAVDAILASTHRNLLLNSDVELVRLGSKKAIRGLIESIDKGDENMAKVEEEFAERQAARKGLTTVGSALEEMTVERMRASLVDARRELKAAFAERGLVPPTPEDGSTTWKKWIEENMDAFPDRLPGIQGAAW